MTQPAARTRLASRYDLVVFDLDGTLIAHHEPIWKTLHERLGSDRERRRAVLADALAGRITYAQWFAADLEMLAAAGATRQRLLDAVAHLRPAPGAVALVTDLRAAGCPVAVLSGGLDLVLEAVLPELTFDEVWINRIRFDADGRIAGGAATPYDQQHKVTGLRHLTERLGVSLRRTAFVGDGPNDVDVARAAGFSIAWGEAPAPLRRVAHRHEPGPDLATLRPWLFERG